MILNDNHSQINGELTDSGVQASGSLDSKAGYYRIEFFASPATTPPSREGQVYLGYTEVYKSSAGVSNFSTTLELPVHLGADLLITATATRSVAGYESFSDTSEFSAGIPATADLSQLYKLVVTTNVNKPVDGNTSSIAALLANPGNDGKISLREALQAINNTDTNGHVVIIEFDLPPGERTITVENMLPQIHRQVIIDGTIDGQPGIVLNGANQAQNGLRLYDGSDGSVVRGMIIQDFTEAGIDIKDSDDVTIAGNWIGLDAAGTGAAANGTGVRMANSEGTLIGGTTPADRNVISGNSGVGVRLAGAGTTNNTIAGNYIGLDASGAVAIGNGWEGVHIGNGASGNTIGGANASARNVISGNGRFGINITASGAGAANNVVQHNYIGTDATGVAAVSNGNFGIVVDFSASNTTIRDNLISGNTNFDVNLSSRAGGIYVSAAGATIQGNRIGLDANGAVLANGSAGAGAGSSAGIFEAGSSHDVEIGGTNALDANIIAGNIGAGVIVNAPGGISILGNSIHANTGLGIDLGGTGVVTENDPHDTDTGPNSLQNFPELEQALSYSSGELLIRGTLDSNSGRFYRIEFFASADGDASGHGEGQSYLGFVEVETDSTGAAAFTATLAAVIPPGHVISATATRLSGASGAPIETSEFAANIIVQTVLVVDTVSDAADGDTTSIAALLAGRGSDGRISLREALEAINTQPAGSEPVRIEFAIPGGEVHIITLGDLLPAIKRPIILDATTDDSFAHNGNRPAIVLDGGGSVEDGLDLREGSDGSTIRGLIIQNFTADGIDIARSHGNTIVGNWIGLDASGIASAGNQQAVNIWDADNNTIGGVAPGDRNVLSGNLRFGIAIGGSSSGN